MSLKIISGGQTGVDRGALDAALAMNVACGGWCPENRMADDGVIPDQYPVKVLPNSGYRKRTKQNVIDSDATVIIYFDYIFPKGGTELTLLECIRQNKPYVLIDAVELSTERAAEKIYAFVIKNKIVELNVAGPKAQHLPHAHHFTQTTIELLLKKYELMNDDLSQILDDHDLN
ncbi:putative molybdenum carrier protein [Acinetobacter sp. Marseille-Q1618]|uniref:putative molybdenum carrier protein n=1 Tax=Acinetobacter sp. Marseille-Q1618 TaxID=2697502 RepID=UPI00156FFFDF|nr:putative molybdenum carrier protein [Acinetobacter sp. Marseille-Q1618]